MQIQETIEQKVLEALRPQFIELLNESHMHSVPANSETHFKLTLVATTFEGISKVKRHQQIYALLAEELQGPVHALALHLYTPQEWQSRHGEIPQSPQCLGGSKREAQ